MNQTNPFSIATALATANDTKDAARAIDAQIRGVEVYINGLQKNIKGLQKIRDILVGMSGEKPKPAAKPSGMVYERKRVMPGRKNAGVGNAVREFIRSHPNSSLSEICKGLKRFDPGAISTTVSSLKTNEEAICAGPRGEFRYTMRD